MIDPSRMTRYDLTKDELEETILFAVCVAGHNALSTAKSLDRFLKHIGHVAGVLSPFECIRRRKSDLEEALKMHGIGCYNQRARSFRALAASGLDLRTCTPQDLEKIPGIAEKTSRFFVLHTRKNARIAVLDTHVRKYLNAVGVAVDQKATPKGKKYLTLEQEFLRLADKSGMTVAEFDLMVWNYYAGHSGTIVWIKPDSEAA